MRQFWRTVTGKMLLFLSCGVCGILFAATILGSVVMVETDFYTREEKAIREEVFNGLLSREGRSLTWKLENDSLSEEEAQGSTGNLTWQIVGMDGKVKAGVKDSKEKWQYTEYYEVYENEEGVWTYPVYDTHVKTSQDQKYDIVHFNIDESLAKQDAFFIAGKVVHILYGIRYTIYIIMAFAFVLGLISFVTLMNVTGRRTGSTELYTGPLYGIPADLLTVIIGTCWLVMSMAVLSMVNSNIADFMLAGGLVLIIGNTFLGYCMSIAARVKGKTLWKNTLIYKGLYLLKKICKGSLYILMEIPVIWKVILGAGILSFLEFFGIIAFSYDTGNLVAFWLLEKAVIFPIVFYGALMIKKLQKGAAALAEGELAYQIDTKPMRGDFKKQGEDLNSIASGMSLAVEKQLKSERMKTELITNVSHDIKTPLTSIINYADLIGKEPCENEKITEYAEVLVRQSVRLKRLIEDLVEASKASTGNLEVCLQPCVASVFLIQADGEYEEKLQKADLTLVVQQPDSEIRILADGRRMWRVFDNLMNNICKYAQPGTRVYLILEEKEKKAVITFKNTSRDALNISEEELMERFVRGDSSRNTEGNGLGLSIARSLTELQKGTLSIKIDGDLFKAVLEFQVIE
ncbi:sensor histidine kinase [Jingyaoa shaoxingensis]|uniref:histidine kinase n=1 Tax=Jingyaoa shaoxingensis TaxID=2763671 RepID=A0ABR7N5W2_9FIRM|nr:sensor histidine kinase [Jingyaoa shaoxingensis]MBC8571793.1 sensor histidine kinase [Jingyaoa shaoxingensis]